MWRAIRSSPTPRRHAALLGPVGVLGVWGFRGLGFRGLGFRVYRVSGFGGLGFGGLGFGVQGLEGVQGIPGALPLRLFSALPLAFPLVEPMRASNLTRDRGPNLL